MMTSKKIAVVGGAFFIVLLLFGFRGSIVRSIVETKLKKIEAEYNLEIKYEKLKISGVAGVKIINASVVPIGRDTLFRAKNIVARLNPWRLIFLRPDLKYLEVETAGITFVKRDSISNFDVLYLRSSDTSARKEISEQRSKDYSKLVSSFYALFLDLMPSEAKLKNVYISYSNNDYNLKITLEESSVKNDNYTSFITTDENGKRELLEATGSLDDNKKSISAVFTPKGNSMFAVPFLDFRWGAKLMFDTLSLDIQAREREHEQISLYGKAFASSLSIYHPKISPEEVMLKRGEINYKLNVGHNFAELDSTSVITINALSISPWLKAEKAEKWSIWASLTKEKLDAQKLFSSLPKGLFTGLEGIEANGSLDYRFSFHLDMSNVDSLILKSSIKQRDLRIVKMGRADLRMMNGEFSHTVYEKGEPIKSFIVGTSNADFTPLDKISPYLKMAVLQSEDGGFFYHNGFVPDGIRNAMVDNIHKGGFVRGGSSISMQLVKNVYLNRHKTLARKFEEMMMVWLIENNRLVSKDRMFEVYLNIIEWGPQIYGIREASKFWFAKEPSQLDINESIFLASIIPSPRRAFRSFNPDYTLKEEISGYYKLLAERLRVKEVISEAEETSVKPMIIISETARKYGFLQFAH